ncbi:MAG TPA: hypothetical protein VGB85_23450 [Nannocystis sp.]|jgi:uncharacterized membrane protein YgcG
MRKTSYVLALGLTACSDTYDPNPGPKYGELGVGVFLYECPSSGDPFCSDGTGTGDQFPQAFALGGRINLEYDWRDDAEHIGDPPPQLQSAAPSLLTRKGDGFTALATGYAAVLAVTGNNEIVDLVHLHIREIAELQVVPADQHGAAPLQQLTLDRGGERELQAIAVDSDSVLLGGVLGHTWTSADPTIVSIVAGGDSGRARIEALQSGTTTLTLAHDAMSVQLTITVEGEDDETGSESGSESSSSGDSNGDASSDSSGESSGSSGDTGGDSSGSSGGVL